MIKKKNCNGEKHYEFEVGTADYISTKRITKVKIE